MIGLTILLLLYASIAYMRGFVIDKPSILAILFGVLFIYILS
jgi:hypothetical protein